MADVHAEDDTDTQEVTPKGSEGHDDDEVYSKRKPGKTRKTVEQLMRWVDSWRTGRKGEREDAFRDRDYRDGIQLSASDKQQLKDRGQPEVIINKIGKKVGVIEGTAVRNRTDPEAVPRQPMHDDGANAMTDALRHVADMEDQATTEAECFSNFIVEGTCAAFVGTRVGKRRKPKSSMKSAQLLPGLSGVRMTEVDVDELVEEVDPTVEHIPYERLILDPKSKRRDRKDKKFVGLWTWFDLDDAIDQYPKAEAKLRDAVSKGDDGGDGAMNDTPIDWWIDADRQRVKVIELYWHEGGDWYGAHFVYGEFVEAPALTGYLDKSCDYEKHECPIEVASCFVDRDGAGYGMVRALISPQDEINKRRSKALWAMSVNQIIAEDWAVGGDAKGKQAQLARADGVVTLPQGALTETGPSGQPAFQVRSGIEVANAQLGFMNIAVGELDMVGPDLPNVAADNSQQSGRSRIAQQQFASLEQERPNDTFRKFKMRIERMKINRIRQHWTEEKWCRVKDDKEKSGYRFVALNRRMTKLERLQDLLAKEVPFESAITMLGDTMLVFKALPVRQQVQQSIEQQAQAAAQSGVQLPPQMLQKALDAETLKALAPLPELQEVVIENQIDQLHYDIELGEAPDTATIIQEQFAEIADLMGKGLPIPAWMLIEASSLRNKREIVEALKQATQPQPDPMQQQAAMMAMQTQQALGAATVKKTLAQADQASATAQKTLAEIPGEQAKLQKTHAETMRTAAEAGRAHGAMQADQMGLPPG